MYLHVRGVRVSWSQSTSDVSQMSSVLYDKEGTTDTDGPAGVGVSVCR